VPPNPRPLKLCWCAELRDALNCGRAGRRDGRFRRGRRTRT
jgi:hypothetical protein